MQTNCPFVSSAGGTFAHLSGQETGEACAPLEEGAVAVVVVAAAAAAAATGIVGETGVELGAAKLPAELSAYERHIRTAHEEY